MIDRAALLSDLQKLLQRLEADLLQRSESVEVPEVGQRLREEYERAKKAQRTAQNYEDWRSDTITQAAAAWVLSCVFVRFLEDNRLIDPPKIAGPGKRLQQARDEWELYLGKAKQPNERDYLLSVFDELARLPGTKEVFGPHNPIRELPNWLSGDGARDMLGFLQKIDANSAESNKLIHDFTDPAWETRFLGDLYQDLSEAARKKYALLQTPEFVEEFILDRTLEPALNEFFVLGSSFLADTQPANNQEPRTKNQEPFRMIDPACGSGHFLLGSFRRILDRWQRNEPGASIRDLVQRTLDSIHGVDINPYAVAIARFRLLLVAMKACDVKRLADAPAFHFNLVCGDSLLHGEGAQGSFGWHDLDHAYQAEDHAELVRILKPGHYHAVVANPPYITPKDRAMNDAYRERYSTCHMKYSLSVPFMQRLFQLAISGYGDEQHKGGFVGQITSNSFMKREFGRKLIEEYFAGRDGSPGLDLTHVIDSAGAYIPGHGTPTVILFGRNRAPVSKTIRAVMGIRGEPSTPDNPARGLVWSAILAQIDQPGSQSEFVSVADSVREFFHKHPWSIGGGGAAELKERLEGTAKTLLGDLADSIGITCFTLEDDVFILPRTAALRRGMGSGGFRTLIIGDAVRDWTEAECDVAVFPYDGNFLPLPEEPAHPTLRYLWSARTSLANNKMFGGNTKVEDGLRWYEYGRLTSHKLRTPLSIVFAFVATHNHFVLDRGGKIFKHSAPVIKLPCTSLEDDHLEVLGILNCSVVGFLMRQFGHNMGDSTDDAGARTTGDAAFNTFQFNSTQVANLPIPARHPLELPRQVDRLAQDLVAMSPRTTIARWHARVGLEPVREESLEQLLKHTAVRSAHIHGEMVFKQEDLDWTCYCLYGLTDESLCYGGNPFSLEPGQRAFEIVLARRMVKGEVHTTWFERHGSTPITEIPSDWPEDYKQLVERRIELIETDRNIALIEQPEYKRRWNTEPWESQLERALRSWLLDRLESYFDFDGRMSSLFLDLGSWQEATDPTTKNQQPTTKNQEPRTAPPLADIALTSVARLADVARQDPEFMQVGELYRNDPAFDVQRLVAELAEAESVPLLPVLRYKATGLRKRAEWEQTWELQREEDAVGSLFFVLGFSQDAQEPTTKNQEPRTKNPIPVPPRYTSADFLKSDCWRLRGKLDVPKERWVSFPHCEGPDGTPVIAWAGYDHLQLATAIGQYYQRVKDEFGGRDDPRLVPLLACAIELLPWLKQWHNEPDAAFDGMRMGDHFDGFVNEEARQLNKTIPEIKAWQPPQRTGGRGRKART